MGLQGRHATVTLVATERRGSLEAYADALLRHTSHDVHVVKAPAACRTFGLPPTSPRAVAVLRDDIRAAADIRRAPGVVHLTNQHLARFALALGRRPYVVTVHDLIRHGDVTRAEPLIHAPNARDRALLALDARGIRRASAVVAVSETTREAVRELLGVPDERIVVVHQGVDHERFRPVERRLVDEPYVLYVGSEQPRKNVACLLEALAALRDAGRRLRLVKVGSAGSGEADFRGATLAAVRRLGLERDVDFRGYVSDEDLVAYYAGAVCLVLPSRCEGFGLTPLEAMACGCPVVVADTPASAEIVGDAGLVVDPDRPDALAAAIARVEDDRDLRRRLVEAGSRRAAEFDWRLTAARTDAVYELVDRRAFRRSAPLRAERADVTA